MTQDDSTPEEVLLQWVREVAAGRDPIRRVTYLQAGPERVADGVLALNDILSCHLDQSRRDARVGRQMRRQYGQDVTGIIRSSNPINLTLAGALLTVALDVLKRPTCQRPRA
jgi:hypothetical protein